MQRAITENSKNTSNKKGLGKTTQIFFFFLQDGLEEKRDKGSDHQSATGKKNAFCLPQTRRIRAAFLPVPQAP